MAWMECRHRCSMPPCPATPPGLELRISFWWTSARRVSRVVAMEIPMEPPTLRIRLKTPLALPIWSLRSVP